MKKLLLISLLVLIGGYLFAEFINIPENADKNLFRAEAEALTSTTVNFSLDGYTIETKNENGQDYLRISHDDAGDFVQVGKPDLPRFTRLIAIPNEGGVSVNVNFIEEEILYNTKAYPRQPLKKDNEANIFDFTVDNNFYNSGNKFPENIVELGEPAILRDHRIVSVTINPFQYNSEDNSVRIIKNIELSVQSNRDVGINEKTKVRNQSRFFEPLYRSEILNYDLITSERDEEFNQPHIVFIHPDDATILSNLEILSDWKHQKGFDVTLASTAVAGTSNTSIKSYLQGLYDGVNPPDFVCLVGDSGDIPTDYVNGGPGDHYYTMLDGTDLLADTFIGRLSYSSLTEFQVIISKILYYERTPYLDDTEWYKDVLLVGDPSSSGQSTIYTSRHIKEVVTSHDDTFTFNEVYSSPFVSSMNTHINGGVSLFNYRGYIGMSGWDNGDTNSLNNFKMMPLALIMTCETGSFTSASCRSEQFLRAGTTVEPKGAIAAIGTATSSTHTCFNNSVDVGTVAGIYVDEIFNIGGALTRGKVHLYNTFPQNPNNQVKNFCYWNNLMGDPSVEIWTDVPDSLTVTYNSSVGLGTNYIEVNVADSSRTPLESAWVTILKGDDEVFATGYTDALGNIILPITSGILGEVNITVTKHNYIPNLGSFEIIQESRTVSVSATDVDDDNSGTSSGNNNSNVNPGESIEFGIELENSGTGGCNGVTAVLSTDSEFVTITDNTETYGDIASGVSTFSSDDFDFTVDDNTLGGTEIEFTLSITGGHGYSNTDYIYVTVQGPNLQADSFSVIGGNSMLDPGETADVTVTIENIGTVSAGAVYGTLSCSNSLLTINDDTGSFGTVSPSGQATNSTNRFNISASALIAQGTPYEMELQLYNASGYDNTLYFNMYVGTATVTEPYGPDTYGYYAYDDDDIDYAYAPSYSWIEIDSNYGGSGTNVSLSDNGDAGDNTNVSFPGGFNFSYYGQSYNDITVCSNGWIAPGGSTQSSFMNAPVPGPGGPSPMIAPFWDDLDLSGGSVCYYYDAASHKFIIQWSRISNDYDNDGGFGGDDQTFQIVLYDAVEYPSFTGDSDILFQYHTVNNTSVGFYPVGLDHNAHGQYATVGLEDHTSLVGLQYSFNNTYPTPAKVLEDNMAILFTTNSPAPHMEPHITLGSVTVNDSGGNGNADYGETVNLDLDLNNMGLSDATGVSSVLSSANAYITITQNSSNYSNIIGGGTQANITDFVFDVSSSCPDGEIASFELNVTSNGDSPTLYFTVTLNAPELVIQEAFVNDGDNNILDPGETSDIRVTVLNSGGAPVNNIQALLSTSDAYLTINDGNESLASLAPGANSNVYFNVTASASTPIGHMFVCSVDFTADMGYTAADGFVLSSSIFEDNFEYDNGWVLSGEFERGAPGGLGGTEHGNADPSSAFGGSNVLGTDLTGMGSRPGDYESNIGDRAYQAVSPAMNCTNYSNVTLEFQRWLNVERNSYDHAYVDVYDGSSWNNAWANGSTTLEDNTWSLQTIDISAHADGNNNVKIRFCIGSTDYGWEYSGWNIDDVVVTGDGKPIISVTPASFEKSVSPGGTDADTFSIENFGGSALNYTAEVVYLDGFVTGGTQYTGIRRKHEVDYTIPFIKEVSETDFRECTFSIDLYDSYGDGWNGGSVDILINGSVVLGNLTLASGSGPESHDFTVNTGDMISTNYSAGSWGYENEYVIYDNDGTQVAADGVGGVEPSGLGQFEGTCTNDPTVTWLTIDGENTVNGTVDVGSPEDVLNLFFDTVPDNLTEGVYNANIVVTSNDPDNSEVIIPVELTVQASLNTPQNTAIMQSGNNMVISWTAVTGANSYKIYSDTDPYGSFSTLEASGVGSTNWSDTISGVKRYYRVVASTDASSRNRN